MISVEAHAAHSRMAKRNIIIIYLVAVFVACTQYRANMRYCVRRGFHVFGKDNNGNLLPISLLPLGLRSGFGTRTSASLLHYIVRTTVFPLFLFIFSGDAHELVDIIAVSSHCRTENIKTVSRKKACV